MGELDIDYAWEPLLSSPNSRYVYPHEATEYIAQNYSKAAVYRWAFFKPGHGSEPDAMQSPQAVYIGETENLARRLRGYLHPGPSQATNKRMKAYLDQELKLGTAIALSILRFETFHIIIDRGKSDSRLIAEFRLGNPFIRKMMENFAIIVQDPVTCDVLNKSLNPLERRQEKADKALRELSFSERRAAIGRRLSSSKRASSNR
jgi:hypothetical protein